MLNRSGESGHPCLVPDFRGNAFNFSPLSVMFAAEWSEVAQSCPTLCDPMDCSLPGSSVHGIFQTRILEWIAISFSKCLLWVYHIWLLLCWGMFLLGLLSGGFSFFIINRCWILSKAFFASIEIIIWFLSFNLLMWCITLIDLQILKNPCPGIKPTWSWCMIFLICCWILFARTLLRIFASMFIIELDNSKEPLCEQNN